MHLSNLKIMIIVVDRDGSCDMICDNDIVINDNDDLMSESCAVADICRG